MGKVTPDLFCPSKITIQGHPSLDSFFIASPRVYMLEMKKKLLDSFSAIYVICQKGHEKDEKGHKRTLRAIEAFNFFDGHSNGTTGHLFTNFEEKLLNGLGPMIGYGGRCMADSGRQTFVHRTKNV